MDDTFVIQEEKYKNEFFQHINSLEDNIKFTAETTKADGSVPFLDTTVTPRSDGSLETKVYRKPTHTNEYLQWDSYHAINNKYSIISTLLQRARNICSNKESLEEEHTNTQKALTACKYPNWAINRMKLKIDAPKTRQNRNNMTTCRSHITVPYDEGLSETIKNIDKKYGIQVHFKSGKTLKDELVAPKDKDRMTNKSGIIYRFKCDRLQCDEEYIG